MRWCLRICSALLFVTAPFVWSVAQGGLSQTDKNLCDLAHAWFGSWADGRCVAHEWYLPVWVVGGVLGFCFIVYESAQWIIGRWLRKSKTIGGSANRITLVALLDEAKKRRWVFLGKREALFAFERGLARAAFEGTIEVWGINLKGRDPISAPRLYNSEKIESAYFKDNWIHLHQAFLHNENAYAYACKPVSDRPCGYTDLSVPVDQATTWLKSEGERLRVNLPKGG